MGRLILALILLSSLSACTFHKKEESVSGSVRVQLPFVIDGKYSLQIIELVTLENLVSLKGLAARFLIDPDTVSGKLQGRDPEVRYIRDEDGVIVPKDMLSLQLLTVYAHFEKMREMDRRLGVTDKVIWPAKVAVNARYRTDDGTMVNNALYSGQHDALLMVPYTSSALPMMVNAGVLAHEHFHNIFQKMVIEPLGKKFPGAAQATSHDEKEILKIFGIADGDIQSTTEADQSNLRQNYHEVFMRALNEGLADVWGWIYSGDDAFVGRSLPSEKLRRQLDVQVLGSLESMNKIKLTLDQGLTTPGRLAYSYALGTQYARILRNYATRLSVEQNLSLSEVRAKMGGYLLGVLSELVNKYNSLTDQEYLQPSDVVDILIQKAPQLSAQNCFFFAEFVPASEKRQDVEARCQALEDPVILPMPGEVSP